MSDPIRRYKTDEEMTPADWFEHKQSGQRPERPEYVEARSQALADAGLESDRPGEDPEDPETHARRRYGR